MAYSEGTTGEDNFTATDRNEFFIGDAGRDSLSIDGNFADYTITVIGNGRYTVSENDTSSKLLFFARDVERLVFNDRLLERHSAPDAHDGSVQVKEDHIHQFAASDFKYEDDDGDALAAIVLVSIPKHGTLTYDGSVVEAGTKVDASELSKLVWTPPENRSGDSLASFRFKLTDAGGLDLGGANTDPTANTLVLDVSPVVDKFVGSKSADKLFGTIGDDVLNGKAGNDKMWGRGGSDIYVFSDGDDHDIVGDFVANGSGRDVIDLAGVHTIRNYSDLLHHHMSNDGHDLRITGEKGDDITLWGNHIDDVSRANFVF